MYKYLFLRSVLNFNVKNDTSRNTKTFSTDIKITSSVDVTEESLSGSDGIEIEKIAKSKLVDDIAHKMLNLLDLGDDDLYRLELVKNIPIEDLDTIVRCYVSYKVDDEYRRKLQEKRNDSYQVTQQK